MKIVVDTNILFSGLLTPFGKIADLLTNPKYNFEKYCCHYTMVELFKYHNKIIELSKQKPEDVGQIMYGFFNKISFINESQLQTIHKLEAYELTKDIDEKDTPFVALVLAIPESLLWTGDKKLINGLRNKDFQRCISTEELFISLNN
jgi:predicted nucleic acid-binding protein